MNIRRQASSNAINKQENDLKSISLKHLFDIKTLDLFARYVVSENANIRLSGLALVRSVFNKVRDDSYGNDQERIDRIHFIKRGLVARLDKHLRDKSIILQYISGGITNESLINENSLKEISDEELAYINEQSVILSNSYFVEELYEEILNLSSQLKSSNVVNRETIVAKIREATTKLYSAFNKADAAISTEPEFSLHGDNFEQVFRDIYARETSPSRCLKTGLTGLNRMIDGGLYSGRVYLFFGTAATGKSFLALDVALQIAKYNRNYKTQDPTKKPCIIFLTMENSVQENVARMFNMMTGVPMRNVETFDKAMKLFKEALKDYAGSEINFYMEYQPYLSQSTDYLYQLVDKVKANGEEPICVIQDHIKRIRPVEQTRDMRQDLGNIVNEFKKFANDVDIPLISISHLNRDAAKNIGENKNKKDIIRTLGSNNVSDSLLMVDNCDVGIILNKETDSKGNLYMGFMQIKTRTKCDLDVFFQPFKEDCSLKMIEDADSAVPSFKITLMDRSASNLKTYTGSDYKNLKKINHDDEDAEYFSADNMSEVTEDEEILTLNNKNQEKFIISGQPSTPIYPMSLYNQQPQVNNPLMELLNHTDYSEWELELQNLRYQDGMRSGVYFFDDNNMVIHDGLVSLPVAI